MLRWFFGSVGACLWVPGGGICALSKNWVKKAQIQCYHKVPLVWVQGMCQVRPHYFGRTCMDQNMPADMHVCPLGGPDLDFRAKHAKFAIPISVRFGGSCVSLQVYLKG